MWSFTVVVGNPLRKNGPKMPFVERNHPIETLAPCRPDEACTVRVRLRRTHRREIHIESLKSGRHHDEKVAGEDSADVIVEECRP